MKPIKLSMHAFVSYKDAEVDFAALGQSLYLIGGKTGAGKTTIFDAMLYALYGEVSGRNRTESMLHSDFCPLDDATRVVFSFEEDGVPCKVERVIRFAKKRETGEIYQKTSEATLWEGNKPPIQKKERVTARIKDLLHMDCTQFQQIVMLAQGEFRKFLDSNSSERMNILRTLFDTREHARFQELLKKAANEAAKAAASVSSDETQWMERLFQMPDNLSEEERNLYTPLLQELPENLESLVRHDSAICEAAQQAKAASEQAYDAAQQVLNDAKHVNEALDSAERAQAEYDEAVSREPEMLRLKEVTVTAEKAVRRILPNEKQRDKEAGTLNEIQCSLAIALRQENELSEKLSDAKKALAEAKEHEPELEALKTKEGRLKESLPQYDQMSVLSTELENVRNSEKETEDKLCSAEKETAALEAKQKEITDSLFRLEGADGRLKELESRLALSSDRLKDLKNLWKNLSEFSNQQEKERELEKAKNALCLTACNAVKLHTELNLRFLTNQAGLMADQLREDISAKGAGTCPVCRTVFHTHGQYFAVPEENAPSQAEVDRAKVDAENASEESQKANEAWNDQRVLVNGLRETLLKEADRLSVHASLEEMKDAIEECGKAERSAHDELAVRCKTAEEEQRQRGELLKQQPVIDGQLVEKRKQCDDLRELLHQLQKTRAEKQAALEEIKKRREYPDRFSADKALRTLGIRIKFLKDSIDNAETSFHELAERHAALDGQLKKIREHEKTQADALEQAEKQYQSSVSENGFADEADYHSALAPIGTADAEQWLKKQNDLYQNYFTDREAKRQLAEARTKETEGLSRKDLEVLEKEARAAAAARTAAGEACEASAGLLRNHTETLQHIRGLRNEGAKKARVFERLKLLSETANGSVTNTGRHSFENYVLAASFRDILEAANERLAVTSGGRYTLVYQEDARFKNAVAGLDMDIVDHFNDHQRQTGSISGGEGFQVSMALALGLSDVVQNHAGSIRIDSMFIDEGFGSLDSELLEKAIRLLEDLSEKHRQIGIISHVERLDEYIRPKLSIECGTDGSRIELIR